LAECLIIDVAIVRAVERDLEAVRAAKATGEPVEESIETIAEQAGRAAEEAVQAAVKYLETLELAARSGPRADGLEPGSLQAQIADAAKDGKIKVNLGNEDLNHKILKKLSNPDLALYKIQQTLYKFAFLIVPLSIPFVALLFLWKRGFTLYDHGVFVLYSLTYMAIVGMFLGLFDGIGGPFSWLADLVGALLLLSLPVHMYRQLKGAYGLSIFSALWRTVLLLNFCTIVLIVFLLAIIVLGLGG
jgi:hypothetical protein